ncbi:hypothetical protein NEAUS03_0776 [Nematocida ausubeli]|nr:hypothetical protein NEAUS03_0776 [Nematocida ausubeli]
MQDKTISLRWLGKHATQSKEQLKIDPIKNLPLMESSVEIKKNKKYSRDSVGCISRPTRVLQIWYPEVQKGRADPICLCFLCDGESVCSMCNCASGCEDAEEKNGEVSFVNAKKECIEESLHMENKIDAFTRKETSAHKNYRFDFCQKCMHLKSWPIISIEERMCTAKFITVGQALAFYQAHKYVLLMSFGDDIRIPLLHPAPRVNLLLGVLDMAFSAQKMNIKETEFECTGEERMKRETRMKAGVGNFVEPCKSLDFIGMASGRSSNIVLQERIREMTQEGLLQCISTLTAQEFVYLAKHKYGTYVIQLIISQIKEILLVEEVKKHMAPYSTSLLQHEIGNYVIQKIINYDVKFVFDCFMKDFKQIASSKIGSRAFKGCIKHFHLQRKEIIRVLSSEFLESLPFEEQKVIRTALKEILFVNNKGN